MSLNGVLYMKISAILHQYNHIKSNIQHKNEIQKDNVSFCSLPVHFGRDLVNHRNENLPNEIAEKMPKGTSIYDLISRSQKPENILGQGANSVVYKIPQLEDYVLKVLNKDDPNKINMNEFPNDVNLGQPVWQDEKNPRILILKKIEGNEHSIPNWSKTVGVPLQVLCLYSTRLLIVIVHLLILSFASLIYAV